MPDLALGRTAGIRGSAQNGQEAGRRAAGKDLARGKPCGEPVTSIGRKGWFYWLWRQAALQLTGQDEENTTFLVFCPCTPPQPTLDTRFTAAVVVLRDGADVGLVG